MGVGVSEGVGVGVGVGVSEGVGVGVSEGKPEEFNLGGSLPECSTHLSGATHGLRTRLCWSLRAAYHPRDSLWRDQKEGFIMA